MSTKTGASAAEPAAASRSTSKHAHGGCHGPTRWSRRSRAPARNAGGKFVLLSLLHDGNCQLCVKSLRNIVNGTLTQEKEYCYIRWVRILDSEVVVRVHGVVASTALALTVAIVVAASCIMSLFVWTPPARATGTGTCLTDSPFAANTTNSCTVLAGEAVEWTAIGGMGGAGGDSTSDPSYGGVGAKITGIYENTTDATVTLYLRVGKNGADGSSSPPMGGEGGGLTAISLDASYQVVKALVIAGGGGGGGGFSSAGNNYSDGGWADPSVPGPAGAGGSGVNDGDHGFDGGTTSTPGAGGGSTGGAGGAPSSAGTSGTSYTNATYSCTVYGGRGGDGYRLNAAGGSPGGVLGGGGLCGSGGGGGAGYAGGGGGAVILYLNKSLGRGGGGGSSLVPAGATATADDYGLGPMITFNPPTPKVTSVSPTSGPALGGTAITITGRYFQDGVSVTIGGNAASDVVITSSTTLTATTPSGTPGAQDIVVSLGESGGTGAGLFTYTAAAPTVTGISPSTGPVAGGTSVTITGTGFTSGATVTIGGASATGVIVNSSTSITATTPAGTAGAKNVSVSTGGGTGTGTGLFTFTSPPPDPGPNPGPNPGPEPGPAGPAAPTQSVGPAPSASATTARPDLGLLDFVAPQQTVNIPVGGLPAGGSVLLVNGQPVALQVAANADVNPVALVFSAVGFNMRLEGRGDQDDPLGLVDKRTLILQSEVVADANTSGTTTGRTRLRGLPLQRDKVRPTAQTRGDGFASNSPVKLYLLSIGLIGSVMTDASGSFAGSVPIPPGIKPGVYTLQANGFAPDYSVRSLNIGVLVKPTARRTAVVRESVYFDVLSPVLSRKSKAILRKAARTALAGKGVQKSVVVGYVQPAGASSNDQALSQARADAVASYLRSLGVRGVYLVRGDGKASQVGSQARRVDVAITYQVD